MSKEQVEKRKPDGFRDYFSLVVTTCGVGYLPLAPGTWGSLVAIALYLLISNSFSSYRYTPTGAPPEAMIAAIHALILLSYAALVLLGMWAAGRSIELLGSTDASQAVIDEVTGQLTVFLFIPFTSSGVIVLSGFLLFRLFDIWKPYPIDRLQDLPRGVGVCVDDIAAGIYAGIVLAVVYAIRLQI